MILHVINQQTITMSTLTTIEDVINRLQELEKDACQAEKQEIDSLKQSFYKLLRMEEKTTKDDNYEGRFKEIMSSIKQQRIVLVERQEEEEKLNLEKKNNILERLKKLIEAPEDAHETFAIFKQLQQEWQDIKDVPITFANEIQKNYQDLVEKFYDQLKLSNEFREYDFKKNLERKTQLCEAAEKLAESNDIIGTYNQLQELHKQYKEVGPVAKELREEIWVRFKKASTVINKRHQQFFEEKKEQELTNLDQKTVMCEIAESINENLPESPKEWEEKVEEITALQEKWKSIGFAPQKQNTAIYERFRKACDTFFNARKNFYSNFKNELQNNLEKKKALVEKVEELKTSTEWRATADSLISLQKEWKQIGPVPKRFTESLWKQFMDACNYFYDQKKANDNEKKNEEHKNLELKKAILEELTQLSNEEWTDNLKNRVHALASRWGQIGHVPFKEKDKVYKAYHELIEQLQKRINQHGVQKKLKQFKNNLKSEGNVQREKERLIRMYENMKNDLKTYENNLGFLTSTSKHGNTLLNDLNRKIEKLRTELEVVAKKIEMINNESEG